MTVVANSAPRAVVRTAGPAAPNRLLWAPGDLHAGAITQARMDTVLADVPNLPVPQLVVHAGDAVEDGTVAGQDDLALDFFAQLPEVVHPIGNHDLGTPAGVRTIAEAEAGLQMPRNQVIDLGDKTLIIVSSITRQQVLDSVALDFLDDSAAAATKDCFVWSHCPLENTVSPTTNGDTEFSSNEAFFSLDPNAPVLDILNTYPRIKVFGNGHTHSPLSAEDLVKLHNVGSRNVLCINTSALYYTGRTVNVGDPIISPLVSWDDDSVSIDWRDHVAQEYVARPGQALHETHPLPA